MKLFLFTIFALFSAGASATITVCQNVTAATSPVYFNTQMVHDFPISVSVKPGSGDTVKIEYSNGSDPINNPTGDAWVTSTNLGAATAAALEAQTAPITAFRATTTVGASTDKVCFGWNGGSN